MTPGSLAPITAREITGDELARTIEAKERQDADAEAFDPPAVDGATYWDKVQKEMRVSFTASNTRRDWRGTPEKRRKSALTVRRCITSELTGWPAFRPVRVE